jgi:uncharacterized membrane protein
MNRVFRIIKLIFLVLSLLLCLAIPVSGLISTARGWHGVCQGFNHDTWNCPWWEYAGTEMFWASFLFVPLLFAAAVIWLVMAALQFIVEKVQKPKEKTDPTNMSF